MPRQCRYFIRNIPQHVIARGVDRQAVFFNEQDYSLYLEALQEAAATNDCLIHAYVLMTNHVHLLVTPGHARSLPLMMQALGRTLRAALECSLLSYGHIVGGPLQSQPGSGQQLLADLPTVHRAQSRARPNGCSTRGLPVLELCAPCRRI